MSKIFLLMSLNFIAGRNKLFYQNMVKLCCIQICPNSRQKRGVPCYPFPAKDEILRGKWIEFVGVANPNRFRWKGKSICAEHFRQMDLAEISGLLRPVDGAIPSIYSPEEADGDEVREHVPKSDTTTSDQRVEMNNLHAMFCRICLKKAVGLIPFNSRLHNENLVDIVYTITGLELDENETNLPAKVCAICVGKIDLAFNVRKEFLHSEKILRNLITNGQLEAHYRSIDSYLEDSNCQTEVDLGDLSENIKTELVIEPVEEMEEEHLYEEEEEGTTEEQPLERFEVEILSDTEKVKEEKPSKKIVYSWKELYKPKRTREVRKYKITEDLPEPELIPHTCYVCDTVHEDADALDSHIEKHVGLLPYTCEQCTTEEYPQELKSLISLNKHLQSHLYPYVCDFCPLRYMNKRNYISHMRGMHESGEGYTCDDCGQFFTQKRMFSTHIYKHKAIKEEKFKCEHCGKAFSNSALLTRHIRIHTGEKPYECKKCGKRFNHESIFQVHKRAHIGEKAHACRECDKIFINSTMLRYHMAEHFPNDPRYRTQFSRKRQHDDQSAVVIPYVCDGKSAPNVYPTEKVCDFEDCKYTTSSIPSWYYHRSTHVRKFQCEICARRFPTKQTLVKHVETAHEGKVAEKTKPCPYCGRKFSSNQKLQCHVDTHENNRRHKCKFCDKAFVQIANLRAHERIHTGEKPFVCRACPSAFITSSGRKKHERSHVEMAGLQQTLETKVEYGEIEVSVVDE
ncbi:zinc finger protein 14-like isoform X2 [Armigeres subalbatus]|uniref:zinc finger protein 14-like isoform X2 n=1 Tax=Armigeres subalbatus TaxID=124917 RepID=UPI002ED3050E